MPNCTIQDRIHNPSRLHNKDAHDIYRLLLAIDTDVFVSATARLINQGVSSEVTRDALDHLADLFARGADASGSARAGAAEESVGDPARVAESVALLAQDLLDALGR